MKHLLNIAAYFQVLGHRIKCDQLTERLEGVPGAKEVGRRNPDLNDTIVGIIPINHRERVILLGGQVQIESVFLQRHRDLDKFSVGARLGAAAARGQVANVVEKNGERPLDVVLGQVRRLEADLAARLLKKAGSKNKTQLIRFL